MGLVELLSSKIKISTKTAFVATKQKFTPTSVIVLPKGTDLPILITVTFKKNKKILKLKLIT